MSFMRVKNRRKREGWGILLLLFFSLPAFGEDVKASLTMSDLTPGTSSSFSLTPTTAGATGSCSGTVTENWSGVTTLSTSACDGRYAGFGGVTRYGYRFDSFHVFRSILNDKQMTVVNSNANCPAASTTYNYLLIRARNWDDFVAPTDFTSNTAWVGGAFTYNPSGSPLVNGISRFSLNSLSSNTTAFGFNGFKAQSCSGAELKADASSFTSANRPLDRYASILFGNNLAVVRSVGGNPLVAVAAPQVALSSVSLAAKSTNVFSGLMTHFTQRGNQVQKMVYLIPNSTGSIFTIQEGSSVSDTSLRASWGSLDCSTLNQPLNGFCKGTLSRAGIAGTGKATCMFAMGVNNKDLIFCSAQNPANTKTAITILAGTSGRSVLSLSNSTYELHLGAASTSGTIPITVTNLTSRPIPTLSPSSLAVADRLSSPFTALLDTALTGSIGTTGFLTGSTCSTALPAFSSCTVTLTYTPPGQQVDSQVFRLPYDNGTASLVNATATLLASRGLNSITVTAPAMTVGLSGQATVTANFANGTTQNITAISSLATSSAGFSVNGAGSISSTSAGTGTISANFGSFSGSGNITSYNLAPNPTSLSATASSTAAIGLSWASGGAGTVNYQIAYQSGASAPANCNAGTVVTAATQGSTTMRTVMGLSAGTQYSFRVCATNAAGTLNSGATVAAYTPAADPSNLVSTVQSSTSIALSWTAGAGASQYQIAYQSGASAPADCNSGTVVTAATQGSATSRTFTGLTVATQYSFRVCSTNAAGTLTAGVTDTETTRSCNTFVACTGDAATCASAQGAVLSGGTLTTSGTDNIHTFTASGSINVTTEGEVLVLLVGGGGGGGGGNRAWGGGGGGGVLYGKYYLCAGNHTVTVGAGGLGKLDTNGLAGGTTTLNTLSAFGGNGAGAWTGASSGIAQVGGATVLSAKAGGSGYDPGVSFSEYRAGGGGGAGAVGGNSGANNGGNGGAGLSYDISGATLFYAGGGGGALAQNTGGTRGAGGSSVGGQGGLNGTAPTAAVASRGAGGGGGGEQGLMAMGTNKKSGTNGSAGIVIIRYPQ